MRFPSLLGVAAAAALTVAAPAYAVSGGGTVDVSTVPFVAGLGSWTGTLIAPDRVLTAAHCIDPATGNNFVLSVGVDAHDFSALPQSAFYGVKGVSIAPGFKLAFPFAHKRPQNATAVNDIAMIVLDRPVPGVTPVAIAGPGDAALEQPGDSGGPLLAQGPNGPVQIGVTSWGSEVKEKGCGEPHPLTLIKGATTKRFKRGTSKTRGKKLACAVTAANAGGSWTVYSPSVAG